MTNVWFITGAARGLGKEIALAALSAGDRVVASARSIEAVHKSLGPDSENLLAVELDVSSREAADAAVKAATSRFGGIDVLVNNAGYGHLGFFEELSIEDANEQLSTNLLGVFNITWAALPVMRVSGSGKIFNVSSLGGLMGGELSSLYCASKFGLEGFSECLAKEVAAFGISVTIVEPGPFRTDFLKSDSLRFSGTPIGAYDQRREQLREGFVKRDGQQPGDPVKLAKALIKLSNAATPPLRFLAGSIAVTAAEAKLTSMRAEFEKWRELSVGTDGDFA